MDDLMDSPAGWGRETGCRRDGLFLKILLEYARHNPAVSSVFKKADKKISEGRKKAQMFWQGEILPGSRNIFLLPFCLENEKTVRGRGGNQREKADPSRKISLFPFFLKKGRSLQVRKTPPVRGRGGTQWEKADPSREVSLPAFFLKKAGETRQNAAFPPKETATRAVYLRLKRIPSVLGPQ